MGNMDRANANGNSAASTTINMFKARMAMPNVKINRTRSGQLQNQQGHGQCTPGQCYHKQSNG